MISTFWCNGLILWFNVPANTHLESFRTFEDGYCCPIKFEVL